MRRATLLVAASLVASVLVLVAGVALADSISGGPTGENLPGTPGPDNISGGGGGDTIKGFGSTDRLFGDSGGDTVFGNHGFDNVYGGTEDDTVSGDQLDDEVYGGSGVDELRGNSGDDKLFAVDDEADTVISGGLNDTTVPGDKCFIDDEDTSATGLSSCETTSIAP